MRSFLIFVFLFSLSFSIFLSPGEETTKFGITLKYLGSLNIQGNMFSLIEIDGKNYAVLVNSSIFHLLSDGDLAKISFLSLEDGKGDILVERLPKAPDKEFYFHIPSNGLDVSLGYYSMKFSPIQRKGVFVSVYSGKDFLFKKFLPALKKSELNLSLGDSLAFDIPSFNFDSDDFSNSFADIVIYYIPPITSVEGNPVFSLNEGEVFSSDDENFFFFEKPLDSGNFAVVLMNRSLVLDLNTDRPTYYIEGNNLYSWLFINMLKHRTNRKEYFFTFSKMLKKKGEYIYLGRQKSFGNYTVLLYNASKDAQGKMRFFFLLSRNRNKFEYCLNISPGEEATIYDKHNRFVCVLNLTFGFVSNAFSYAVVDFSQRYVPVPKKSYSFKISKGWNLVPVYVSDPSFSGTCNSFSVSKIFSYKNGEYQKGKLPEVFSGFWYKSDEDCFLNISGLYPLGKKMHLYPGWNIISSPVPVDLSACKISKGPFWYQPSFGVYIKKELRDIVNYPLAVKVRRDCEVTVPWKE